MNTSTQARINVLNSVRDARITAYKAMRAGDRASYNAYMECAFAVMCGCTLERGAHLRSTFIEHYDIPF